MYATIRAETGNFSPSNEGISKYNSYTFPELEPVYDRHHHFLKIKTHEKIVNSTLLGRPYQKYEEDRQVKNLGNAQYGDGQKFKGRGFVQLTGRENYRTYSREVHGLEANPQLAEKPENAAKLIVAYVLKNKAAILKSLDHGNLTEARIVVNGRPKKGKLPNGLHEFSSAYETGKKVATPSAASAPSATVSAAGSAPRAPAAGPARTAQAPPTPVRRP